MAATTTIPTRTKMEMLALVDKTIAFYRADPNKRRAVTDGSEGCAYQTSDGRRCAVGRYLLDPAGLEAGYSGESISHIDDVIGEEQLQKLFQPEFRGYSVSLWRELQRLHDTSDYWTSRGLTKTGREELQTLKDQIGSNFYLT